MRHKAFFDHLTVLVALVLLISFAIALPLLPKKDFSGKERRTLTPFPTIHIESLLEGRFFASLSDYYADHFPLREYFTALKATAERAFGKGENNGILFGKEGYLIARGEYESLAVAQKNLAAIRARCDGISVPVSVAILPRAVDVLTPYLPHGYEHSRAALIHEQMAKILPEQIDLTHPLSRAAEQGEKIWYRTDHHWTSAGAYLAYAHLAPSLGVIPYGMEDFTPITVSENFLGTSFARSGLSDIEPDTLILYRYEGDDAYTVENGETGVRTQSLYAMGALDGDDPYEVFLGGNFARLTVTDEAHVEKPTLLLFKDSFANALIPFLARHFQLVIVDPRYEQRGTQAILDEVQPDRVLILFGADTVATTPSLTRLGR